VFLTCAVNICYSASSMPYYSGIEVFLYIKYVSVSCLDLVHASP